MWYKRGKRRRKNSRPSGSSPLRLERLENRRLLAHAPIEVSQSDPIFEDYPNLLWLNVVTGNTDNLYAYNSPSRPDPGFTPAERPVRSGNEVWGPIETIFAIRGLSSGPSNGQGATSGPSTILGRLVGSRDSEVVSFIPLGVSVDSLGDNLLDSPFDNLGDLDTSSVTFDGLPLGSDWMLVRVGEISSDELDGLTSPTYEPNSPPSSSDPMGGNDAATASSNLLLKPIDQMEAAHRVAREEALGQDVTRDSRIDTLVDNTPEAVLRSLLQSEDEQQRISDTDSDSGNDALDIDQVLRARSTSASNDESPTLADWVEQQTNGKRFDHREVDRLFEERVRDWIFEHSLEEISDAAPATPAETDFAATDEFGMLDLQLNDPRQVPVLAEAVSVTPAISAETSTMMVADAAMTHFRALEVSSSLTDLPTLVTDAESSLTADEATDGELDVEVVDEQLAKNETRREAEQDEPASVSTVEWLQSAVVAPVFLFFSSLLSWRRKDEREEPLQSTQRR